MSAPKVLIADDSPLVLRMIEKMLEGAGFSVDTAKDGIEAIEKAFSSAVDLIILDVMMPRMNGYQACRLLKAEPSTREVPVVILTSKDQPGDRFWGIQTGADHYVTKDADPQRILELVKTVAAAQAARQRQQPPREVRHSTSVDILSKVNDLLDRKLFEATLLTEIGRVARSLVHFDETFTSVMGIIARVVDYTIGAMAFVEDEDLEVVLVLQRQVAPAVVEETKARVLEAVAQRRGGVFTKVQARLFAPGGSEPHLPAETNMGGFVPYPIETNGRLTGLLALAGKGVGRLAAERESFLGEVANVAQIVTENSRLFDRIKNLSVRDGLTDLFNHRHSVELLASEFDRVGRYEGGVSLLMIDLDHFKKINDEHGHPAGDAVLREVARLMKDTLRTVDALGRYGGEEFVAILPHTSYEEGLQTAERLRKLVQDRVFRFGTRELRTTISIGVASYPSERVDSPATLIREADQALYRAKESGRNSVA